MNFALKAKYRTVLEQVWMPIFGKDEFDTETLLEGCRLAGLRVIEYTLRRDDAPEVLPTLRSRFPEAMILVGSTVDSVRIVRQLRQKHSQLRTLEELSPYVDGFVSMLPFSNETLDTYSATHLCITTAETGGEALRQLEHGAAFIKVLGPDFSFSRRLHAAPTFGFCPTYITGGVTCQRMQDVFASGNLLCATGFDVVLQGEDPKTLTTRQVAQRICKFVTCAKTARAAVYPMLSDTETLSDDDFFPLLPNFCSLFEA